MYTSHKQELIKGVYADNLEGVYGYDLSAHFGLNREAFGQN